MNVINSSQTFVDGQHKCELCSYASKRKSSLDRHVKTVHYKVKAYKCEQCDYAATCRSHLNMHVTSVHTKEKPYKCHLCSVGFPRKDSLTRHIKGVHNKEGKGNSSTNPAINVKIERAEAAEAGRETIYTTVNPIPNNIQYSVKQEAYEMNSAPPATDFLQIQHNR